MCGIFLTMQVSQLGQTDGCIIGHIGDLAVDPSRGNCEKRFW